MTVKVSDVKDIGHGSGLEGGEVKGIDDSGVRCLNVVCMAVARAMMVVLLS